MSLFSKDKKWKKAKQLLNHNHTWLEVISYYKSLGGTHVSVYSVIEGDKRLIVDLTDDDQVLLVNKHNELVKDTYDNVLNSRKVFEYHEDDSLNPVEYKT
ncbi:UNVERIFIED_ORG: hypothetical protein Xoosp15_111 [Xanthomonas phage Xoo-sp15]